MNRLRIGLLLLITAVCCNAYAQEPSLEALLADGIYAEESQGDLDKAIALYQRVIDEAETTLGFVAGAQYRLGRCYLKQGRESEAFDVLLRLTNTCPDERELVDAARASLAHLLSERVSNNQPSSWVYFDSREADDGPTLLLDFDDGPRTAPAAEDTVLLSYLPDRVLASHKQLSLSMDGKNRVLIRFALPKGRSASSLKRARLSLRLRRSAIPVVEPFALAVHSVTESWAEQTCTWRNQPGVTPDPLVLAFVQPDEEDLRVDVTEVVREWLAGGRDNSGLLLKVHVPFYGPPPIDTSRQDGKHSEQEIREATIPALFNDMIHGKIGYQHYAGLWALIAKAREGEQQRTRILEEALRRAEDPGAWGYERWLCCHLLAGLGGEVSLTALAEILRDPSAPTGVRSGAAQALGAFEDEAAQGVLRKTLEVESNARIREALEGALAGDFRFDRDAQAYVAPSGAPEASPAADTPAEDFVSRLTNLGGHKQAAFSVVPMLIDSLPPDEAYAVVEKAWPGLANDDVKTGVCKAFAFRNHPRVLDVLHLGMTDRSMAVKSYVKTYVGWYAFQDFAEDYSAYGPWRERYAGMPLEQVVLKNCERVIDELKSAEGDDVLAPLERLCDSNRLEEFPAVVEALRSSGLAERAAVWLRDSEANRDLRRGADRLLAILQPDEAFLEEHVLPLAVSGQDESVRDAAIRLIGRLQYSRAVEPLLASLVENVRSKDPDSRQIIWSQATALAELGDPKAIPAMIAAIDLDNTYDTVYGIGYFGLGELTGVEYDESHDGAWWREWWERNKSQYPLEVREIPIPDLREAEESTQEPEAEPPTVHLSGWGLAGSTRQAYSMGEEVDAERGSVRFLKSKQNEKTGFGTLMRQGKMRDANGSRATLTADIRSEAVEEWAGLWLRFDGPDGKTLFLDNMHDHPIKGTTEWTRYETTTTVPDGAERVAYGVLLSGDGQVWFGDAKLEFTEE